MPTARRAGMVRPLFGLLMLLGTSTAALAAQAPGTAQAGASVRRSADVTRLADGESIHLDGRLDEPIRTRTVPAADFRQIEPQNGQAATEPTEVHLAFSADALYIGIRCFDSEPDKWMAVQKRRDEGLPADDKIRWTIDTFLDGRSGYFFEMNPLGSMADAIFNATGQNRQWDGIWEGRALIHETGWNLEIRIPFRTLNFNPTNETWGMNFERTIQRKNEVSIWTGWARNQGLQRMANAGLVSGIRDVTQGHGLDIKPYLLGLAESFPGRGRPQVDLARNAGIDLFYNPTPTLRATFTVNTDFAQTEVDQRQVNLTRFSLFFPERRDFFLDGTTFFDFASTSAGAGGSGGGGGGGNQAEQVHPFFSRRVGLSAEATPQKIDVGTKLTGQAGQQDVGVLFVRSGDERDRGFVGEDFAVARVKRRLLQQSYIGAMFTHRDGRSDALGARQTLGADGRLATNQFLGSQNLSVSGWLLHTTAPGQTLPGNAFGATLDFPNDRWAGRFDVREIQRGFSPDMGFVARLGYRRYQSDFAFGPRPRNNRIVRRYEYLISTHVMTDLQNRLLERTMNLQAFQVQYQSGDNWDVEIGRTYERLDTPFRISRGITLPLGGEYSNSRVQVRGQTANRRVLSASGRFERAGFYSGTRNQAVLQVNYRARPGLLFYLNGEWNAVRLAEGAFQTRLFRIITENQFSPWMAVVNNVQFDTVSRVMGWQSRFRWIMRPGNDLYVVYTHNWVEDPLVDRFATLDRRLASKVLYTYRF